MAHTEKEKLVIERIDSDLAKHKITCLHRDGLYGHWRCQNPDTWNMGFIIVTWPGSLCFTGDMGDYLFQRTQDMIAFMRGSCMSYSYAAEKCVAHDGRLTEFSEEVFRQTLQDCLKEYGEEDEDGECVEHVQEKIDEIMASYNNYSSEHDAMKAMYESGLWDGCDMPDCKTYTFHFLWCLHAIKWFCERIEVTNGAH